MGYRISELAHQSGFRASTLRYYESIGLLPSPGRTEAGYRVYDEAVLDRLAFIRRAKTMGFALEDITDLVSLWADGPCGPVHDRLESLLDAKVDEVHAQIDDLCRFEAQLDHVRSSVAATEPAEHCGPGCGCEAELPKAAPATILCTLSDAEVDERSTDWAGLLAHVSERRSFEAGVRLRLPAEPNFVAQAAELAARETECCAFFSFRLTIDAGDVWLEVAAPPDGRGVLDALFETRPVPG